LCGFDETGVSQPFYQHHCDYQEGKKRFENDSKIAMAADYFLGTSTLQCYCVQYGLQKELDEAEKQFYFKRFHSSKSVLMNWSEILRRRLVANWWQKQMMLRA
jgi:hypothetical protein